MEPSEAFRRYAVTLVLFEAQRLYCTPTDVVERRLWAAAVFDWFNQSGELVMMLDGLDLSRAEAREYEKVVQDALDQFARAGNALSRK